MTDDRTRALHACSRCDWTPGSDAPEQQQRAAHAAAEGHWLCIVCQTASLAATEMQTCIACVGRVRRDLIDLRRLWVELHAIGFDPIAPRIGRVGGRSSGVTVPGGVASVLRSPGNRIGSDMDKLSHGQDEQDDDPPSVLAQLAGWEDDWRSERHEPAAGPASVASCLDYLDSARLNWAASHHEGFDEFASDIATLASWVRRTTGHDERPTTTTARCNLCDWTDGPPPRLRRDNGDDDWHCVRCRRLFTDDEMNIARLATDARVAESAGYGALAGWLPVAETATAVGRPMRTVRDWIHRGLVTTRPGLRGEVTIHIDEATDVATRLRELQPCDSITNSGRARPESGDAAA